MFCPYCSEDIPEEALVCKVCHRDLQLVLALNDRIRRLEDQARLFSGIGSVEALGEIPDAELSEAAVPHGSVAQAAGFIVICCAGAGWLIAIASNAGIANEDDWKVWLPLGTATLFPIGLALWFSVWRKISWPSAILAGLSQASLLHAAAVSSLIYAVCADSSNACEDLDQLIRRGVHLLVDPEVMLFTFFPPLAIFLSSFWLGSKSWKSNIPHHSRSRTLARKILSRGKRERQKPFEHRVKRLASIFSTLAPVLTLIASILVPLIGYLVSNHKSK